MIDSREIEAAAENIVTNASAGPRQPIDVRAIFPEVDQISDETLRNGVIAVWDELWSLSPWENVHDVPTGPEIPYPTIPHNQCVMAMALAVADSFERFHGLKVDRDRLIAAAVLQDASKVVEFARGPDGKVDFTPRGQQYPHAFWGAHVALKHGIPDDVVHIIIYHTPQSAKFPESLEGKILYYVDQIDVLGIHKDRWRKDLYITK